MVGGERTERVTRGTWTIREKIKGGETFGIDVVVKTAWWRGGTVEMAKRKGGWAKNSVKGGAIWVGGL